MRIKLILSLLLLSCITQAQVVQQMTYKDYSFPHQVNIGGGQLKTTHSGAYLEIGPTTGATRGLLLPRGSKGAIGSPTAGMFMYDIPTQKIWWHNGSSWQTFTEDTTGGSGLSFLFPLVNNNGTVSWQGTTSNVPEGTNKYYLDSRVAAFGDTRYPQLSVLYNDPSWIDSLSWSKIKNKPLFQSALPYVPYVYGQPTYLGGDQIVYDFDSTVRSITDTIYVKLGEGTIVDSIKWLQPLQYNKLTREASVQYWRNIFNANRWQGWYVSPIIPNGSSPYFDSAAGMMKWKFIDTTGGTAALGDYYTKTELQTSGSSQVHWGNITNAPSFLTSVPTWQQVLTAGSTLTQNNTINIDSYNLDFERSNGGLVRMRPTLFTSYVKNSSSNYSEITNTAGEDFFSNIVQLGAHHSTGSTIFQLRPDALFLYGYENGRSGTAIYNLGVDANGKVITVSTSSGPSYSFSNGLTNSSGTVKLGGFLSESTVLGLDNYGLTFANYGTNNGFFWYPNSFSSQYLNGDNSGAFTSMGTGGTVIRYLPPSGGDAFGGININQYGVKLEVKSANGKNLQIETLPTYADDAAASAGGLQQGMVYKTSTGELRIKL